MNTTFASDHGNNVYNAWRCFGQASHGGSVVTSQVLLALR